MIIDKMGEYSALYFAWLLFILLGFLVCVLYTDCIYFNVFDFTKFENQVIERGFEENKG